MACPRLVVYPHTLVSPNNKKLNSNYTSEQMKTEIHMCILCHIHFYYVTYIVSDCLSIFSLCCSSMMAVTAGAEAVYACERSQTMCDVASEVLCLNKMSDEVTLIPKSSTDIIIPQDIPQRSLNSLNRTPPPPAPCINNL